MAWLNEMLIGGATKRRAGITVQPSAIDADEDAAVSMTARCITKS
jgi:hypothetical protein